MICAPSENWSAWASAQSDQSSLSAQRNLGSLATHWAHSEDSDQTGHMPRLSWVSAGCTCWSCHTVALVKNKWFSHVVAIQMSCLMTKPTKWLCAQQRLRSASASAQSDQILRCPLNGYSRTQSSFMQTAKTLIRLGGCPGWSESLLGAQWCWFCRVAAQMFCYASAQIKWAASQENLSSGFSTR